MPAGISLSDFYYILPELVLTGGALLVLIADVLLPRGSAARSAWVTLLVLGATLASLVPFAQHARRGRARPARRRPVRAVLQGRLPRRRGHHRADVGAATSRSRARAPGEYYFLILCATLGMMIMAGGIDLITIFIGLETMAVSFYILAGFIKPNQRSNEAAVKYFLLGAFSLGILLYGMSLMYGLSGTTNLRVDGDGVRRPGARSAAGARRHPRRRRRRLQDRGGAVPHVGARRVRRRADADHRVPVGRLEGGVVRDAAADLRRGAAVDERRLAAALRGAGDRHDDGRQPRRADADAT